MKINELIHYILKFKYYLKLLMRRIANYIIQNQRADENKRKQVK
jgi:hypothetical protein